MKSILPAMSSLIVVLFAIPAAAEWMRFQFQERVDAFSDERSVLVIGGSTDPFAPVGAGMSCSAEAELVLLITSDYEMSQTVRVRYRFDDEEPEEALFAVLDLQYAFSEDAAVIADFRQGLELASRLRFQVGGGAVADVPLRGSTAAVQQYIPACALIRSD